MLNGIRVLDLSSEPGFLAGKILGDLGADVVKVEPPGGDREGRRGPYLGDVEDPERSLLWLALNTSKRGITLALDAAKGRELFRKLVKRADVVLESFAPGQMAELGLGYVSLRADNPRLVHCALTPFGQTGPYANYRGHDLVIVAMGGNPSVTGQPDRPPVRCTMPSAYYHSGPEAVVGILMALYAGQGRFVDVSMHETQQAGLVTLASQHALTGKRTQRQGERMGRTREIWRVKDGYISFGLRGGAARIPNLMAIVDYMAENDMAPEWLRSYDWSSFNHNTLTDEEIQRFEEVLGAFFETRTMRELYEQALKRRLMLAPCNNAAEILDQPQLRSREFFVTLEYPELGASIEHPAFFAKSNRTQLGIRRRAPRIGENNEEIYAEIDVGPDELVALSKEGVV